MAVVMVCECNLMSHVTTQIPYAGVVVFWSILVGTIPIRYGNSYPNAIAILLGLGMIGLSAFFLGVPVINSIGSYSPGYR